jgi:hypothetical protein
MEHTLTITVSEELYQAILAGAAEAGCTPEEYVVVMLTKFYEEHGHF